MDRKHLPSSALPETALAGAPTAGDQQAVAFAGFRLEADGALFRGNAFIHLPPRELAALRQLLRHAGQIVTPAQLRQQLWGDVHVTADSVLKCMSSLRARLQPDDCIQTVYKRGYRLLADVRPVAAPARNALLRLAILPFATGTDVPEHLGSAVAEDAIARLSNARTPIASILARDSVFTLAANGLSAQQIGEALKADLVLTGNVRLFISRVRLRVEMIRVADGVQIWAEDLLVDREKFAGLDSDLTARLSFRLQSRAFDAQHGGGEDSPPGPATPHEPARTVYIDSHTLKGRASGSWTNGSLAISASASQIGSPESNRREAKEMLLRGRHEWQTLERHRMQDGLHHLTRALELDPSLTAARVDLVNLCVTQELYGYMSPSVSAEMVHRNTASIDDPYSQAPAILPALGWVHLHFDRDLAAGLTCLDSSSYLSHDPWTTRARAMFSLSRHRFDEAIALLRAAIQLDPFSPWLNGCLAWALHLDGQAKESVEQVEHALRFFPSHEGTALYAAMILAFNGKTGRAAEMAQGLAQRQPQFDLASVAHAYAAACAGRADEARTILERLQWLSRDRFVLRSFHPAVFAALGDLDAALKELYAADQCRCPWFLQMLADPRLHPLHGHPDFEELRDILPRMEAEAAADSSDQMGLVNR